MQQSLIKNSFFPLFMVILLDVAGIILILPVLTPLILSPDSLIISQETSLFWRDFLYGGTLALFPLCMFFSTPVLGDLSDKYGRKKILFICLIASALSYFVAACGIRLGSLSMFLASRVIAGLAAGTQPIATAAIIDLSTPKNKTRNLAWVVFMCSIGFVIGPLIGGITSEKKLASWFNYETPFIISAILCLINAVFLEYYFKEVSLIKSTHSLKLSKGFTLFMSAFSEKKFCLLSLLCFCFVLSWSLYYQTITWFFMAEFHYTQLKLGLFVGFIGIVFMITTGLMNKLILRVFSTELNAFIFFVFTMGIAATGSALSQSEGWQWLWAAVLSASDVICYTTALSLYSNLVAKESQGWIMGVISSICAITWAVSGLITGPLGYINLRFSLLLCGIFCFISFVLMFFYRKMISIRINKKEAL